MKTKTKMSAIVLSSCMVFASCMMPTYAASEIRKEESVFAIMDGQGSVKDVTVSDWLHSDEGFKQYEDESVLENVVNLKGDEPVVYENGHYIWNSDSKDLYYQGNTTQELPFEMQITYKLDGTETKVSDLFDKSGHLEMEVNVLPKVKKQDVYVPLAVAVMVDLDQANFSNISCENGMYDTDSKNQVIAGLFLPGLKENYEGILDTELSEVKEQLSKPLTISCDVTEFKTPEIMGLAASSLDALKEMEQEEGFADINSDLQELKSATKKLQDGTSQLLEATSTFDSKMGEMSSSYEAFYKGLNSAYDGTTALKDGMNQLNTSINLVKSKINAELIPGLTAANTKKDELLTKMNALKAQLEDLQLPDLNQIQQKLTVAFSQIFDAGLETGVQITTGKSFEDYVASLPQENAQVIQAKVGAVKQAALQKAGSEVKAMLETLPMDKLQGLQEEFKNLEKEASEMLGSVSILMDALYIENDDLTNPKSLAGAIMALSVGSEKMNTGSEQLYNGMTELKSGSDQIKEAISKFKEGTTDLKNGSETLNDGMNTYAKEGISKITDNEMFGDLEKAKDIQEKMSNNTLNTYAGLSDGTTGRVKFVFRVDDQKVEEKKNDVTEEIVETPSFFERLFQLF